MLYNSITTLTGIGPSVALKFSKLGIKTIHDLLWYMPLRHLDFSQTVDIGSIKPDLVVTCKGTIKSVNAPFAFRGRVSRTEAVVSDKTGSIKVIWFNQPYIAKSLSVGEEIAMAGKAVYYKNVLQMQNPIFEKLDHESIHTGRIVPVYKGAGFVSSKVMRKTMALALKYAVEIKDIIPQSLLKKYKIPNLVDAVTNIHFPASEKALEQAKNRLAFEELLIQQLANKLQQKTQKTVPAPPITLQTEAIKDKVMSLPFSLTASQKRAVWDIIQDTSQSHPMVRLVQGDVGSGKTMIAVLSAYHTTVSGWQTAIVAPTEILASQHYEYFTKFLPECTIGLLTQNSVKNSKNINESKTSIQEKISNGDIQIIVGTHALLQKSVNFSKLALVVIDEQHRFGVKQRSFMLEQTQFKNLTPHLLSMSATPIPRTLALGLNGNLKLSSLNSLPSGKKKIQTQLVEEVNRRSIYEQIGKGITQGHQAFIVTPRVEDTENSELKSAKLEFEKLQKEIFPNTPMGLLYGTMKGPDKDKVMKQFVSGEIQILVATTVIEIGIDIPQASFMIIEDAQRFGLSQLHQLRGRIGRAGQNSYCYLFSNSGDPKTNERLKFFCTTLDGFALAEKDLEQRGFGNLFGTEQSGFSFKFGSFFNIQTMKDSQLAATELLKSSPSLAKYTDLKQEALNLIKESHQE